MKISPFDIGIDASPEKLKDAANGTDAVLDINISGTEPAEYAVDPGSYGVSATVLSKADGTVVLIIR